MANYGTLAYVRALSDEVVALQRAPGSSTLAPALRHAAQAVRDVVDVEKGPIDVKTELEAARSSAEKAGVNCSFGLDPVPMG
jgi:hypothetical protein